MVDHHREVKDKYTINWCYTVQDHRLKPVVRVSTRN